MIAAVPWAFYWPQALAALAAGAGMHQQQNLVPHIKTVVITSVTPTKYSAQEYQFFEF
jgi:hypothetical protein